MGKRLRISRENGTSKTFVWVIDWPGWCRSGKTFDAACEALLATAPRYRVVATAAGLTLPDPDGADIEVVDEVEGDTGTEFGVPSKVTDDDRRPVSSAQAKRIAGLVEASWTVFDRVAAKAPPKMRKGPRGGGRDRDKMIDHVLGADHGYARELAIRLPEGSRSDRDAVTAERAAVLDLLRTRSDGSPIADRRWTPRYAARRIAWHALDHAWEMEDKAEP